MLTWGYDALRVRIAPAWRLWHVESMNDITQLLHAARSGDSDAKDRLFTQLYGELKQLAAMQVARGQSGGLSDTSLVHESYLRLSRDGQWTVEDRQHFCSLSARVMRHIAIDDAREQQAGKRGGGFYQTTFSAADALAGPVDASDDVMAVNAALEALERAAPELATLVELRFFAGLSLEEASDTLAQSLSTTKRDWRKARAFLLSRLTPEGST